MLDPPSGHTDFDAIQTESDITYMRAVARFLATGPSSWSSGNAEETWNQLTKPMSQFSTATQ